MTGMILDGVLMLLLVAALGYGIRLERKLTALRAGQVAFASAVTELNTAAGRAEAALSALRESGQETDLLHDRIVKARELKLELEGLVARVERLDRPQRAEAQVRIDEPVRTPLPARPVRSVEEDERALRMAALAQRIQGRLDTAPAQGRENVAAILGAMGAQRPVHQTPKPNLNRVRRSQDEDLFAA